MFLVELKKDLYLASTGTYLGTKRDDALELVYRESAEEFAEVARMSYGWRDARVVEEDDECEKK